VACLVAMIIGGGCGSGGGSASSNGETNSSSASESAAKAKTKPKVSIPTGLSTAKLAFRDVEKGSGATAKAGDEVTVQYVGVGFKTRKEFDSSWSHNKPLTFKLGSGEVIEGWDRAIEGMKVGGRREMLIPAKLAYGSEGTASIAPNEPLVFVVDLLAVE
jgi:peptidylprolyl isomerase